jgi:hypothetical protein
MASNPLTYTELFKQIPPDLASSREIPVVEFRSAVRLMLGFAVTLRKIVSANSSGPSADLAVRAEEELESFRVALVQAEAKASDLRGCLDVEDDYELLVWKLRALLTGTGNLPRLLSKLVPKWNVQFCCAFRGWSRPMARRRSKYSRQVSVPCTATTTNQAREREDVRRSGPRLVPIDRPKLQPAPPGTRKTFAFLSKRLRLLVRDHISAGLTTGSQLARQSGYQQAHISNFLSCHRGLSMEGFDRILQALNITIEDLI